MSLSSSTVGGKTKYKIVLLGNQHVGKTAIIDRFINDRFESNYNATIGIDFLVRNLTYQNKTYRLQLWDTAGQERFKSLIPSYLKDSHLCILVYDMSNSSSLEDVQKWMELYNQHKEMTAFSILVGNKKDISIKRDEKMEEQLKKYKDINHFEISAKSGEGVSQLFYTAIDLINNRLNSIKIIDLIDENDEKDEKDDKVECSETVKPVIEQTTTLRLDNTTDCINKQKKKKCC